MYNKTVIVGLTGYFGDYIIRYFHTTFCQLLWCHKSCRTRSTETVLCETTQLESSDKGGYNLGRQCRWERRQVAQTQPHWCVGTGFLNLVYCIIRILMFISTLHIVGNSYFINYSLINRNFLNVLCDNYHRHSSVLRMPVSGYSYEAVGLE